MLHIKYIFVEDRKQNFKCSFKIFKKKNTLTVSPLRQQSDFQKMMFHISFSSTKEIGGKTDKIVILSLVVL